MGFSSIIATGIMVIVLIVAGYIVLAALNSATASAMASQATVSSAAESQLRTSLALSSPGQDAAYLEFNVTNDGDTTIDDVADMDIFVKPVEGRTVTGCSWLPYMAGAADNVAHWYVLYQAKNVPGSASSLGPGDVMRVRCTLGGTDAPAMGEITVAAPGGTTGTMLYNGPLW